MSTTNYMIKMKYIFFLIPLLLSGPSFSSSFVTFESGHVRPLALSPDGRFLFAVNTPDNRLEVYKVKAKNDNADGESDQLLQTEDDSQTLREIDSKAVLEHMASIPVGMEPVALAIRSNKEVWVVNHLSDSVSIVKFEKDRHRVVRTLYVGDEPRDIVFAGQNKSRAFITTAHRGQNIPYDPELTTPGVGRADVWVFDANNLGASMGGVPLTIVNLFSDTPRALTVGPKGKFVYAAAFHSGNKTTVIDEGSVCDGGALAAPCNPGGGRQSPGGLPAPNTNLAGEIQPEVGLIVKNVGDQWLDEIGRDWGNKVTYDLPDYDVFKISTAGIPKVVESYSGVGTSIFSMVVNPKSGAIYVSNTEAQNEKRFEGKRSADNHISSVIGEQHKSRISVIKNGKVLPRHLNKHIDYSVIPSPEGVKDKSLALPRSITITPDGQKLYLAAKGSDKIGIIRTSKLEDDSFSPDEKNHIEVSGGGPSGLVLDSKQKLLYVSTRYDNGISIIDTQTNKEIYHVAMFNPEPEVVTKGRRFLYDANLTSSNGEASCGSCHVDGDVDHLAWDLGDPTQLSKPNLNVQHPSTPFLKPLHPMKGPMMTQSFRGMANHGPMHWRGDRTAADTGGDPSDEVRAFKEFNVAFEGLLGREGQLSDEDMQAFSEFALQLTYPPNPNRALDNSLTASQAEGEHLYFTAGVGIGGNTCQGCHRIDRDEGHFGSDETVSIEPEPQDFKVPHFRNLYTRIGMFGRAKTDTPTVGDGIFMGDQVRGFGFIHDGSVDTLFRFHGPFLFDNDDQRRRVEDFLLVFDSNLAPIVGQQVTLSKFSKNEANARIDLLVERAEAGECDVIVKGNMNDRQRGWYRNDSGKYVSDKNLEDELDDTAMRSLAKNKNQELTFTCAPPGSGVRMGIDRDEDGIYDFYDQT